MRVAEKIREVAGRFLPRCPNTLLIGGVLFFVGFLSGIQLSGSEVKSKPDDIAKQFVHSNDLWKDRDSISGFFNQVQLPEYERLARNNGYTLLEDILRATDDDLRKYLNMEVPAHRKRVLAHSAYICERFNHSGLGCENYVQATDSTLAITGNAPLQAQPRFPLWIIAILLFSMMANNAKWSEKSVHYTILFGIYLWFVYRRAKGVCTRLSKRIS